MITLIHGKIPRESNIKVNVDDARIQKAIDGGTPLVRSKACGSIKEIADSLRYVHEYTPVNMVIQTEDEALIAEFTEKEKAEFFWSWNKKANRLVKEERLDQVA